MPNFLQFTRGGVVNIKIKSHQTGIMQLSFHSVATKWFLRKMKGGESISKDAVDGNQDAILP